MGECCGSEDGGEAHELKQGAHDEEEEPMYYNTHTHTYTVICTGKHAHTHVQAVRRWGVGERYKTSVSLDGGRLVL